MTGTDLAAYFAEQLEVAPARARSLHADSGLPRREDGAEHDLLVDREEAALEQARAIGRARLRRSQIAKRLAGGRS